MSDDDGDRKFDPTPHRREQFRKEGKVARARDAGPALGMLAAVGALVGTHSSARVAVHELFAICMGDVGAGVRGEWAGPKLAMIKALGVLIAPPIIAAALGCIVAGAAQSGIQLRLELAGFKMERLDPIGKIKQMFSISHGGRELALALLKVGVVGFVGWWAVKGELATALALASADFETAGAVLLGGVVRVVVKILFGTALVAAVDYAQSWFQLSKQMKMTMKELKEEMRSEDGDPHVKAKIKARARAAGRRRMMADVKTAAVVVTNPTHVAVAIRYDDGDPAPVVVAKGHDEAALAIRREAREQGVPIVENRRLARTLDAEIAIGSAIKVEHFGAVARVLAFVMKLGRRRRTQPRPQLASPRRNVGPRPAMRGGMGAPSNP